MSFRKKEQEEFLERSVMTTASNCDLGHCGCYYTNCNVCCRCKEVQLSKYIDMTPRNLYPTERPWKKVKRPKDIDFLINWIGEVPPTDVN